MIEFVCGDCDSKFKRSFDWTGFPEESVCPKCKSSNINTL